mmetsp:Transcript_3070/g.4260  ORF Transcript_3070/g.4260 Transcript_3070/m.4260 type:complete len:372 (+) Transcript_3070:1-1116(+)
MPFQELLRIAQNAAKLYFTSYANLLTRICDEDDILDASFFWIDVFCKNQHIPAPAMEEFHKALKAPGKAVIALHPKEPVAFQRIWCLFEIWTAIVNDVTIIPTMSEEAYSYFNETTVTNFKSRPDLLVPIPAGDSKTIEKRTVVTNTFKEKFWKEMESKIHIHVEDATATYPADIVTIMELIHQSTSVSQLNNDIFKAVCDTLWKRIENDHGYSKAVFCFDGNGFVLMWDGTKKQVKDVRIGDAVVTVDGKRAEIVLITRDSITTHSGIDVCNYNGVFITPEHPILWSFADGDDKKEWIMSKHVLEVQRNYSIEMIYNFELNDGASSVIINGLGVMTLGQVIGFDVDSDALYGWGWKNNPSRQRYLLPTAE